MRFNLYKGLTKKFTKKHVQWRRAGQQIIKLARTKRDPDFYEVLPRGHFLPTKIEFSPPYLSSSQKGQKQHQHSQYHQPQATLLISKTGHFEGRQFDYVD